MTDRPPREDGPTELVEGADGELVERLSGGTATLLLVWLIGVGALSTLLAVWAFAFFVLGERLGIELLFADFGFYTAIAGASGPCLLWLAGRAQGHGLGWFMWTAARIALVMVVILALLSVGARLLMGGSAPTMDAVGAGVAGAVMAVALAQVWAVATWAADRWIARARVDA